MFQTSSSSSNISRLKFKYNVKGFKWKLVYQLSAYCDNSNNNILLPLIH